MFKLGKKNILITVVSILTVLSLVGCQSVPKDAVAKVNNDFILEEEFNKRFDVYEKMYEQQFGSDIMNKTADDDKTIGEVVKERLLESLIVEKIVLKEAERNSIKVTDKELKERLDNIQQMFGGKENFKESLKSNNITEEYYKEDLKRAMIMEKYQQDYLKKSKISDEDSKKYFEKNKDAYIKVRASHILLEKEDEAKKVLEEIKKGQDFNSLATKYSIDKGSAVKGGDLGFIVKGDTVPEFEEAVFSLKVGKVSDIVKSKYGYHIIKLEEKLDKYEKLKDNVVNDLKEQNYYENLTNMRQKAKVEIYDRDKEDKENKDKQQDKQNKDKQEDKQVKTDKEKEDTKK